MTRARLDSVVTVLDADLFHSLVRDALQASTVLAETTANLQAVEWTDSAMGIVQAALPAVAWTQLQAADVIVVNKQDLLTAAEYA